MFCFEKIYTFSVREEDFKQRFWAQAPFLSHIRFRVLGAVLLRISVGGCAFGSRVLLSFYSFVGGDEEVTRSSFVWKPIRMSRLLCIDFLFFLPSVLGSIAWFLRVLAYCKLVVNIFLYICVSIYYRSAMGLIISSPLLLHNVLSLNITLGLLFVFLSYNLVGYRFVFILYSFLFYQ